MKIGNGWNVEHHPKSIRNKSNDWNFWHDETDDIHRLGGYAASVEEAKEMIIDIELEHPYFNEEK